MAQFLTEKNVPNAKVVASTIVGMLIPLYLAIAPMLHLPTFDQAWMSQHIDAIIAGVVSVMAIVAYFKAPHAGDGITPKV